MKDLFAALYCRLSKDDENSTESSSISTQKDMLLCFAKEQGFVVFDTYVDDGYSGTNFERPAFIRMKNDIESGKINIVITKDLSRLGRDYIVNGTLIEEYFPQKKIRYIAITDDVDTDKKYNDIAPFKNVINEMYARDISNKIKSAFETKMKEGKFIGSFAPYGYRKSLEDKNKLVVNNETAIVVRKIFEMACNGERPTDIAKYLNNKKIPSPAVYRCINNPKLNIDSYSKRKEWTSAIIQKILKNMVYTGNMVQHKSSKPSFKSKIIVANEQSDWIIVENTHEPIVDDSTFDLVQNTLKRRRNKAKTDFTNVFSGIAKCADCGNNMSITGKSAKGSTYNLVCGKYKLYGSKECTNHFIDYDVLYNIVLSLLNKHIKLSDEQKDKIIKLLVNDNWEHNGKNFVNVNELNKRLNQIEIVVKKLYEDYYLSKISVERFNLFLERYEEEKAQINFQLYSYNLENDLSLAEKYKCYFDLYKDTSELTLLNSKIVNELVDKIVIHQGCYIDENGVKKKNQKIEIYFKFDSCIK